MDDLSLLLQLFWTFFLIGAFNFGGGGAMITLIQTQVVTLHGWLSEGRFTDIIAISQATPGPIGINCATYVGYQVMHDSGCGLLMATAGSLCATFAVVLPSFLIFLMLVRFYNRFHTHPVFTGVMKALKPAVAGLLLAAALVLTLGINMESGPLFSIIKDNFPDLKAWILFAAAFSASFFFKANPIWIIVLGACAGFLLY